MLKSLHHVGMVVKDMARSLEFYQSALGGAIMLDIVMDLAEFGQGVGIPGAKARIVFLQIPELSPQIELIQYISPSGQVAKTAVLPNAIGSTHVAFLTADINRVHKSFSEMGVRFISTPSTFPADHPLLGGVTFCYFEDPDGAVLELIQIPNQ
jgi:glyoxylase I family protein